MAFPDTFSGAYDFNMQPAEGVLFKNKLLEDISLHSSFFSPYQVSKTDSSIQFLSRNSLLHFEYQVDIRIKVSEAKTAVTYEFGIQYLAGFLFVAVLASLVFTKMTFGFVFFSSFTLILFLYSLAISHIKRQIVSLLRQCSPRFDDHVDVSQVLLDQQSLWLIEKDRCPACGEKITIYDRNCCNCGLKISDSPPKHPSDSTLNKPKRLNYHIKTKKK